MEDLCEREEMSADHLWACLANGLRVLDGEQYPEVKLFRVEHGDLLRVEVGGDNGPKPDIFISGRR